MHVDYYLNNSQTLFGYNDSYDILRIFNPDEKSWDRVSYTFEELSKQTKLKKIDEETALRIAKISPEESMLKTVHIIKSIGGDI